MTESTASAIGQIEQIEFHERRIREYRIPIIEAWFYVKDVEAFLKACVGDRWAGRSGGKKEFDWKMNRVKDWKRPKIEMYINSKQTIIYPKEKLITTGEGGLHYICQHLFDIFPDKEHETFYSWEKIRLGKLFALDKSENDVYTNDIRDGFLLPREEIDKYNDSFVVWIKSRRNQK
jgi:hypothetical protein